MRKDPWAYWAFVVVLLLPLLLPYPGVDALGGTPPSLAWVRSVQRGSVVASDTGMDITDRGAFSIGTDGRLLWGYEFIKSNGKAAGVLERVDPQGGLVWQFNAPACRGTQIGDNCRLTPFVWAHSRDALVFNATTTAASQVHLRLFKLNGGTGVLDKFSVRLDQLATPFAGASGIDSVRINATSQAFVGGGSGRLVRFIDDDVLTAAYNVGSSNILRVTYDDNKDVLETLTSGGVTTLRKYNVANGVQLGADLTLSTDASCRLPGLVAAQFLAESTVGKDKAFLAHCQGNAGSLQYSKFNVTSWAFTVNGQDFMPGQINDGGLRTTLTRDFDVDGSDNLLICGSYVAGAEERAFFGRFLTSNNTMHWNVTLDLGTTTRITGCGLDTEGAIYVALIVDPLVSTSQVQLRKYTGGGFTPPSNLRSQVIPPSPSSTVPATTGIQPLESNLASLGCVIGACPGNQKGQFLWGLILVLFVSVAAAVLALRFGVNPFVPGVIGGVGMIIGVGFIGIWPLWSVVTVGIVAAAILTYLAVRVTGGFGGS